MKSPRLTTLALTALLAQNGLVTAKEIDAMGKVSQIYESGYVHEQIMAKKKVKDGSITRYRRRNADTS